MVFKQVFIVNSDLNMGKGKIVGQALHGMTFYMSDILVARTGNLKNYEQWRYEDNELMKKVVLKATEQEMNRIYDELVGKIWVHKVIDRGLTQIAKDSFTCLVIEPLPEEQCDVMFKHLKLL